MHGYLTSQAGERLAEAKIRNDVVNVLTEDHLSVLFSHDDKNVNGLEITGTAEEMLDLADHIYTALDGIAGRTKPESQDDVVILTADPDDEDEEDEDEPTIDYGDDEDDDEEEDEEDS